MGSGASLAEQAGYACVELGELDVFVVGGVQMLLESHLIVLIVLFDLIVRTLKRFCLVAQAQQRHVLDAPCAPW